MVLVVTILISLMLAGIDWMLGGLIRALLSGGG
jgi:preprotein translocase subunit SecE